MQTNGAVPQSGAGKNDTASMAGVKDAAAHMTVTHSANLTRALQKSVEIAHQLDHGQVITDHLMLALLVDEDVSFLLGAYGVDFATAKDEIIAQLPARVEPVGQRSFPGLSSRVIEILEHGSAAALQANLSELDSNIVLAVLLSDESAFSARLMKRFDLNCSAVLQYLELRTGAVMQIIPLSREKSPPPAAKADEMVASSSSDTADPQTKAKSAVQSAQSHTSQRQEPLAPDIAANKRQNAGTSNGNGTTAGAATTRPAPARAKESEAKPAIKETATPARTQDRNKTPKVTAESSRTDKRAACEQGQTDSAPKTDSDTLSNILDSMRKVATEEKGAASSSSSRKAEERPKTKNVKTDQKNAQADKGSATASPAPLDDIDDPELANVLAAVRDVIASDNEINKTDSNKPLATPGSESAAAGNPDKKPVAATRPSLQAESDMAAQAKIVPPHQDNFGQVSSRPDGRPDAKIAVSGKADINTGKGPVARCANEKNTKHPGASAGSADEQLAGSLKQGGQQNPAKPLPQSGRSETGEVPNPQLAEGISGNQSTAPGQDSSSRSTPSDQSRAGQSANQINTALPVPPANALQREKNILRPASVPNGQDDHGMPTPVSLPQARQEELLQPAPSRPLNQLDARARAKSARTAGLENDTVSANGSVIEKGKLVENVPRKMRVAVPVSIEARISRQDSDALTQGLLGSGSAFKHDVVVTEAMTIQLRAPGGGFHIESVSPATQWLDRKTRHIGDADFGSWKWSVTPTLRGKYRLQLVVSARTMDENGMIAEAALPDRIFDIAVRVNYKRTIVRVAGWAGAAIAGGGLATYGETALTLLKSAL